MNGSRNRQRRVGPDVRAVVVHGPCSATVSSICFANSGWREDLVVREVRDACQHVRVAVAQPKTAWFSSCRAAPPMSATESTPWSLVGVKISCLPRSAKSVSFAERRHLGQCVEAEVAPLELALAEVGPLGERDRLRGRSRVIIDSASPCTMFEPSDVGRRAVTSRRRRRARRIREHFEQVLPALGDVVGKQLDAVDATSAQGARGGASRSRSCRSALRPPPACGGAPARGSCRSRRLAQGTRVDALGLAFERGRASPRPTRGREHLPVVSHALLRPHKAHGPSLPSQLT